MDTDMRHVPVALERVLELLAPVLDTDSGRHPVLVDATTGLGGHSQAVLTRFPAARVIGLDRDPQAVIDATSRLARFGDRVQVQQVRYDQMDEVLDALGIGQVDAVLFDLGVSSMQIDEVDRGFAYSRSAPLDMRMDTTSELTAEEVLNDYPQSGWRGSCGSTAKSGSLGESLVRSSRTGRCAPATIWLPLWKLPFPPPPVERVTRPNELSRPSGSRSTPSS